MRGSASCRSGVSCSAAPTRGSVGLVAAIVPDPISGSLRSSGKGEQTCRRVLDLCKTLGVHVSKGGYYFGLGLLRLAELGVLHS